MKLQSIALTALMLTVVACGTERPNPDDYRHQGTTDPATTAKTDTKKTADATKTATPNTMTPAATPPADATKPAVTPPAATPPATPAATRLIPNATELAAAKTLYETVCVTCHVAVNGAPAKKGRTEAQINLGKANPAHNGIAAKYPVDVSSQDGVENENLAVKAMAAYLK